MVSNEIMYDINMFSPGVMNSILRDADGTSIITHNRTNSKNKSKSRVMYNS